MTDPKDQLKFEQVATTTDGKKFTDMDEAIAHQSLLNLEPDIDDFINLWLAKRGPGKKGLYQSEKSQSTVRTVIEEYTLFQRSNQEQSSEQKAAPSTESDDG